MAQAKDPQELRLDGEETGMPAVAEAAEAAVEQLVETAQDGAERMLDAARELADRVPAPMLKLVIDRAAPAMEDLVRAEGELAAFWLEATREHTRRTLKALQQLAGARDVPAAMTIQGEYLRDSMAGLQEAFARQIELTGALTQRMLGRAEESRRAA